MRVNYRKICQEYYGYSDEEMKGMDVHHIDGNHSNNSPENLMLISPQEHAKIHESEFVIWAREGGKLGNESLRKRLREVGQTPKELEYKKVRLERCKAGLHTTPHTEETKKVISEKKKKHLENKANHPMWGRTKYRVSSPSGESFVISEGWKDWCKENGLSASNMRSVALGIRKHHKGWKAEFYE